MNQMKIYSALPIWMQNYFCSMKGRSLEKLRYGKDFDQLMNWLIECDKWSNEQKLRYKEENLARMLEYVYHHCSYYYSRFKSVGLTPFDFKQLSDLEKFPILTKEDVRANWRGMISDEFPLKSLIRYHTSGSTGTALDFYWTKENVRFSWGIVWRGRKRFGVEKGDCHINFTGKLVVPMSQNRPPYWRYNKPLNQYMLNMQHISDKKIASIVDFINKTDAKFFVGYPSIINSLAVLILEQGFEISTPPKFIFSGAEKVQDYQRNNIETAFPGVKIVERYGFSEDAAAATKGTDDYYHEDFELGHLELFNPEDVGGGLKRGILLATGFQNLGMPFIRYKIGDTATMNTNIGLITEIDGRNEDYIITPEGTRIMRFDYLFKNTPQIKECQVVQNELGKIVIRIVLRKDCVPKNIEKEIMKEVRLMISPIIHVDFEYVEAIERSKTGKIKAVKSNLALHGLNSF